MSNITVEAVTKNIEGDKRNDQNHSVNKGDNNQNHQENNQNQLDEMNSIQVHGNTNEESAQKQKDQQDQGKGKKKKNDEEQNEVDSDIYDEAGNFDAINAKTKQTQTYKIQEQALICNELNDQIMFRRLKKQVLKFYLEEEKYRQCGPSEKHLDLRRRLGVDFGYLKKLNFCLKKMLLDLIATPDQQNRKWYLKKTYDWFTKQRAAIGLIERSAFQKEQDLMNPDKAAKKEQERQKEVEQVRAELMDDFKHQEYMNNLFEYYERTEHKGIEPACARIKQYKVRLPPKGRIIGVQSTTNLESAQIQFGKGNSSMGFAKEAERPITAGVISVFGNSDANTAATAGQIDEKLLIESRASAARAVSVNRFLKFEESEKKTKQYPFGKFYTSSEPVTYHEENRFEGKSSYNAYYPTGEVFEQEMEKVWIATRNKELADKRRDEETKEMLKEWGHARGRVESEIARKKEHLTVATNFEKARGWVRKSYKSKWHQPCTETMDTFLNGASSDEEIKIQGQANSQDRADSEASPLPPQRGKTNINLRSSQTKEPKQIDYAQKKLKFVDLTQNDESYGVRAETSIQRMQLEAIYEHNEKLPPKKKAKEALPEIGAVNTWRKTLVFRDIKKNTSKFVERFKNIGLVDACGHSQDPGQLYTKKNEDVFSINNKTRELQQRASKQRIASLRKHYGHLIGTNDAKNNEAINPFQGLSKETLSQSAMSLSVYNKPEFLSRPKTAAVNIYQGIKGLEPPLVDSEGNPVPAKEEKIDPRFPVDISAGFEMLTKTGQEQARQEQLIECIKIKDRLAKDNFHIQMQVLERAIVMPPELEWQPGKREMPSCKDGLLVNPFPKPKKKGKKKKGKK